MDSKVCLGSCTRTNGQSSLYHCQVFMWLQYKETINIVILGVQEGKLQVAVLYCFCIVDFYVIIIIASCLYLYSIAISISLLYI